MSESTLENRFSDNYPVPPEFFVGREADVERILSRLSKPTNRGGSLISGIHGIGKTSLLNFLKSTFALRDWSNLGPERARFIFLPGIIVTGFVERDFWLYVCQDLKKWLGELKSATAQNQPAVSNLQKRVGELIGLIESDTSQTHWEIRDFFDELGQAELVCVVLLDNLGVLFGRVDPADPIFFYRLRALLQMPGQKGFSLVAASQKPPDELFKEAKWQGSRFDSGMIHIALSGLTGPQTDKLLDVTTHHLPPVYRFDREERRFIQAIHEQTGGHPGKIQRAAYLLLQKKLDA